MLSEVLMAEMEQQGIGCAVISPISQLATPDKAVGVGCRNTLCIYPFKFDGSIPAADGFAILAPPPRHS